MGYLGAHRNDPAEGNPIMQRGWGWNFWSNHLEFEQSNAMQCTREGVALGGDNLSTKIGVSAGGCRSK